MNIREIEEIKNSLNGWNDDMLDVARHYIQDVINGIASEEVVAVFGTIEFYQGMRGAWWNQLPSTKEILNYKGKPILKLNTQLDFDEPYTEFVYEIPSTFEELRNAPTIVQNFLESCCWINSNCQFEIRTA